MTSLQLGLILAGALVVGAVLVYNWLQERKIRKRIDEAFGAAAGGSGTNGAPSSVSGRIEPTLQDGRGASAVPENAPTPEGDAADDGGFEPPLEVQDRIASDMEAAVYVPPQPLGAAAPAAPTERGAPQPDPDIECIVALQPAKPISAGALAAGLHARVGRPIRWFGRRGDGLPWQLLKSDTVGEFSDVIACLLLANRTGAASRPLLEGYFRVVSEIAASVPAAIVAPDASSEAARAEALDRICADLDVQIGLTLLKSEATLIPGTRLRGTAEAAGFRLAEGGRFDWVSEETGAVLYSLQNYRSEPFTAETLRATSTPGAVFVLDVPRVVEPVRTYDQMKMLAKRMAQTLDATLVDDNRRVLDDAALQAIRDQVRSTMTALREVNIEPGSPRALALFGG
jgi:hypothetical protein